MNERKYTYIHVACMEVINKLIRLIFPISSLHTKGAKFDSSMNLNTSRNN